MSQFLDENAQPPAGFHHGNNELKAVNTLYGIMMGITADQAVVESEILYLDLWLKENVEYHKAFPLNIVKRRVEAILEDGIITQEECENFRQVLLDLLGNDYYQTGAVGGFSVGGIFDNPAIISFVNAKFCLTGTFTSGSRPYCEKAIKRFGGIPIDNVTQDLKYLIVGTHKSRDWIATGHGRKIEKAIAYREKGCLISIISEQSLQNYLKL
jgi:hypothetical protein